MNGILRINIMFPKRTTNYGHTGSKEGISEGLPEDLKPFAKKGFEELEDRGMVVSSGDSVQGVYHGTTGYPEFIQEKQVGRKGTHMEVLHDLHTVAREAESEAFKNEIESLNSIPNRTQEQEGKLQYLIHKASGRGY